VLYWLAQPEDCQPSFAMRPYAPYPVMRSTARSGAAGYWRQRKQAERLRHCNDGLGWRPVDGCDNWIDYT